VLHGLVTTEAGDPIPGVVVVGSKPQPVVTDEKGQFEISDRDVVLHFSKPKFQLISLAVSFHTSDLHVTLPAPTKELMVPLCSKRALFSKRLCGHLGICFDIPTRGVTIRGGPDVDYVHYFVQPKTGKGSLDLLFGNYIMKYEPDDEHATTSVMFSERSVVNDDGREVGLDSYGKFQTGELWRRMSILGEGAEYESPAENAAIFERIINSACFNYRIP
jgi:hypothetical protein